MNSSAAGKRQFLHRCFTTLQLPLDCDADIAFMVLNVQHQLISNFHWDGIIQNNCSLFPVGRLIRCIQALLFIEMDVIPEGNCSHSARLTNSYLATCETFSSYSCSK